MQKIRTLSVETMRSPPHRVKATWMAKHDMMKTCAMLNRPVATKNLPGDSRILKNDNSEQEITELTEIKFSVSSVSFC